MAARIGRTACWPRLEALAPLRPRCVLVHDGARPLLTADVTARVVAALADADGAIAALPVADTRQARRAPRRDRRHPRPLGPMASANAAGLPFHPFPGSAPPQCRLRTERRRGGRRARRVEGALRHGRGGEPEDHDRRGSRPRRAAVAGTLRGYAHRLAASTCTGSAQATTSCCAGCACRTARG